VELLSNNEIDSRLASLEGWERERDAIVKTFELADFVGSVEFVDKLVQPAEEMGHHPDLSISWNKVAISITTHAAGGLTENDFELAKRIERIAGQ
jgi:4a-hydroxytetrahydrobiopterin dehydratase